MAPRENAETELEGRYAPLATSIASHVAELAPVVDGFLGANSSADGSVTHKGRQDTTKKYQSLAEWSAAVTQTPSRAWLSMRARDSARGVSIFLDAYGIQIKVTTLDADVEAGRAVVTGIESILGLEPEEEASQGGRASSEREFLFPKPGTPAALLRFLEAAAGIATLTPRTWISIRTRDDAAIQFRSLDDPRFANILETRWSEIVGVDCELDDKRTAIRSYFRLDESILRLHVEAKSAEKVKEYIESLKNAGALDALPKESAFKGRSRLFQPIGPLDAEWFSRATKALASSVPASAYTNCRYRLADSPTEEFVNRDYQQWCADVLGSWDRVANASCWLDGRVARASMRIDPRREQVELSIEAATDARADAIIADLVRDLDLEIVHEASPDQRTGGSFEIGLWGNKQFGKSLEAALKRVFGDRVPAIEEAYIEELVGDEVDRRNITDLGTLLERVKEPEPFGGMGLRAVARDDAIGIYLTPPKKEDGLKRLEIKSSFGPKVFPDLVKIFDRVLELAPLAASGDAGEPVGAGVSSKAFDWRASFLPILFTSVVTLLATSGFWLSVIPSTTLEITIPVHRPDSAVVMPAGLDSVRVEWVIRRKRFGQTTTLRNERATVRVLRTSGQESHSTTALGKVAVPVAVGTQTIEVSTPSGNESDVVRVAIPPAPAPP